jgi:hypothetical protein
MKLVQCCLSLVCLVGCYLSGFFLSSFFVSSIAWAEGSRIDGVQGNRADGPTGSIVWSHLFEPVIVNGRLMRVSKALVDGTPEQVINRIKRDWQLAAAARRHRLFSPDEWSRRLPMPLPDDKIVEQRVDGWLVLSRYNDGRFEFIQIRQQRGQVELWRHSTPLESKSIATRDSDSGKEIPSWLSLIGKPEFTTQSFDHFQDGTTWLIPRPHVHSWAQLNRDLRNAGFSPYPHLTSFGRAVSLGLGGVGNESVGNESAVNEPAVKQPALNQSAENQAFNRLPQQAMYSSPEGDSVLIQSVQGQSTLLVTWIKKRKG